MTLSYHTMTLCPRNDMDIAMDSSWYYEHVRKIQFCQAKLLNSGQCCLIEYHVVVIIIFIGYKQ